ncbi:MAG: MBL fold metallo-hydrolase [Thermoleophilia bacterium]|nr:MBL fold metallo-hydrolase [Thermoleophilia bacterium]
MDAAATTEERLTPLGNAPAFAGGVHEAAPETFAWIQPNGDLGESNAGLIVGDGESVLIDTLWDERLTRRMLDAMVSAREGAPVSTLINTHGDGDHWYGNGLLGGTEIIATERAAAQMAEEPPAMLRRMRMLPAIAGKAAGLPLLPSKERMRGLAAFGEALSAYHFDGIKPRLPTREFSGRLELEIGGRSIELIEVGPAHTSGDAIVWVPDRRVLFSGDIIFSGVTPIMWAGPASNWIAALERIAELEPTSIVPGHGPICDLERVDQLHGYWTYLLRHVPEGAGGAIVELSEELVSGAEYRTSPWGEWRAPERTLINVAMIARERDGESGPIGVPKRIALLSAMGALRERLTAKGITVADA